MVQQSAIIRMQSSLGWFDPAPDIILASASLHGVRATHQGLAPGFRVMREEQELLDEVWKELHPGYQDWDDPKKMKLRGEDPWPIKDTFQRVVNELQPDQAKMMLMLQSKCTIKLRERMIRYYWEKLCDSLHRPHSFELSKPEHVDELLVLKEDASKDDEPNHMRTTLFSSLAFEASVHVYLTHSRPIQRLVVGFNVDPEDLTEPVVHAIRSSMNSLSLLSGLMQKEKGFPYFASIVYETGIEGVDISKVDSEHHQKKNEKDTYRLADPAFWPMLHAKLLSDGVDLTPFQPKVYNN